MCSIFNQISEELTKGEENEDVCREEEKEKYRKDNRPVIFIRDFNEEI